MHEIAWILVLTLPASAATLNVKDYGAKGDGLRDDTEPIQAAIDASAPGDTILFFPGAYRLSAPLQLLSYRSYLGQGGAQLLGRKGSFSAITPWNSTTRITIDGLVFSAAGLAVLGDQVPATAARISNCTFENIAPSGNDWPASSGIFIASGLDNSSIVNNTFRNILQPGQVSSYDIASAAIRGYNIKNSTIVGNRFDTVNEAIYLNFNGNDSYPGVVIANNTGTQVHRMGIELQGSRTVGLQVVNNTFSNFLNPYYNTFGLSIVVEGTGSVVQNNTLIASLPASGPNRYGIAIEAGGTAEKVSKNFIQGYWDWGIALGNAPHIVVMANFLCGSARAQLIGWEDSASPENVIADNTTNDDCSAAPAGAGAVPAAQATPPTIDIVQPPLGSTASGNVLLSAIASDALGIASVQFFLDGIRVVAPITTWPGTILFNTGAASNGEHVLTAVATNYVGLETTAAAVTFVIQNTSATLLPGDVALWLDSDVNVTAINGLVSSWTDRNGNSLTASQFETAAQPMRVAGSPHQPIRFDGQKSSLALPFSINGSSELTIFVVAASTLDASTGYGQNAALLWSETTMWGATFVAPSQSTVTYRFGTTEINNVPVYRRAWSIKSALSLTEVQKQGSAEFLFVNTALALSHNTILSTIDGTTDVLTVGGPDSAHFAGDIYEVIIYRRALPETERQQVETYLMQKYAL